MARMRTSKQIVNQTNAIAKIIYQSRGYEVKKGHDFHTERVNLHPFERQAWAAACEIQMLMTDTDPMDAVDELEDE